jgi:hypothetical protein
MNLDGHFADEQGTTDLAVAHTLKKKLGDF